MDEREGEALRARVLFEGWLAAHARYSALVALAREPLDVRAALGRVASLTGAQGDDAYVDVLMEARAGDVTPAVLGTSARPLRRWTAHLSGLARGEGEYARWRTRLLVEGHVTSRFDLRLYVVGEASVRLAPVPGGGTDVEAVRAELARLAGEAFPLPLLEG
ncbi:hypothetical protein [Deinococcus pimensis]|uniref:hypothetical protein n=1 Tax=Deinococcus pimensis TaxID=309888 RepID=UPI0004B782CA|nr:hypothetical protein [Deinococcus pimensis]